ncbi:MAG: thiamine phosphate synthase [Pseudomonadota bacterium]
MALSSEALWLYLVTDADLCAELGVVETVERATRGGVTCIQLRDKTTDHGDLIELGRRLKEALSGTGVPLIINDHLEVAIACDANGVHVGQGDTDVRTAREALGPHRIVGLSCETAAHVEAIDPTITDYAGIGPVFGTPTKSDHSEPIGLDGLAHLCSLSPIPTVAIGGLKADHQHAVLDAGANGLAVVSAICGQPDPEAAARQFSFPSAR